MPAEFTCQLFQLGSSFSSVALSARLLSLRVADGFISLSHRFPLVIMAITSVKHFLIDTACSYQAILYSSMLTVLIVLYTIAVIGL